MIEYATNHPKGTIIYQQNQTIILKHTLLHTIESFCMKRLFTYEGYRKAVQHELKINHLIPVYLAEDLQLIPTERYRNYDNIYINFSAILSYEVDQEKLKITFVSGRIIYIKMSLYRFKKLIQNLSLIRNTKVKHFH